MRQSREASSVHCHVTKCAAARARGDEVSRHKVCHGKSTRATKLRQEREERRSFTPDSEAQFNSKRDQSISELSASLSQSIQMCSATHAVVAFLFPRRAYFYDNRGLS